MNTVLSNASSARNAAITAAFERTMGVIEFKSDGSIVRANDLFLTSMGYTQEEIQGQHHRMFMRPEETDQPEYQEFWTSLAAGVAQKGQFQRLSKDGRTIWLEASYTPILDEQGCTASVIKFATDITHFKEESIANADKTAAIERSMAVIEFEPDGTIVHANNRFLKAVGYSLDEIKGRHHRIFLRPEEAESEAYTDFWKSLATGNVIPGQFKRITKHGQEIWLEATYNPIFDLTGQTVRVVKFATDVTDKVVAAQMVVEKSRELENAMAKAQENDRRREELNRTLQEMSTPVIPIWDGILLMPLVGVVDSTRTDDVMRKTLTRISETRSKVFILDITGVPTVDTAVANQLIKITKATSLMGCETVISGLSPAIARTLVELGVDVGAVRTTATLRDAFKTALRQVETLTAPSFEKSGDAPGGLRQYGRAAGKLGA